MSLECVLPDLTRVLFKGLRDYSKPGIRSSMFC